VQQQNSKCWGVKFFISRSLCTFPFQEFPYSFSLFFFFFKILDFSSCRNWYFEFGRISVSTAIQEHLLWIVVLGLCVSGHFYRAWTNHQCAVFAPIPQLVRSIRLVRCAAQSLRVCMMYLLSQKALGGWTYRQEQMSTFGAQEISHVRFSVCAKTIRVADF